MPKITKIMLDMDGVIADFEPAFSDFFSGKHNDHTFHHSFENFIAARGFENLEMMKDAHKLINFLQKIYVREGIPTEILSSTAGPLYHDRVKEQKMVWLEKKNIRFAGTTPTLVPGSQVKKHYATPTTIIIDDSKDVIADWEEAGGIAIWHINPYNTIGILEELISHD